MPSMPPWPRRPVRVGKSRVTPLYLIGVDSLKDAFIARLRIEEPSAGFCHFPVGRGKATRLSALRWINSRA
jgi:phage terminase large subunit GpA-like protein